MQVKSVDIFNLHECEEFLRKYPDDEQANAVRRRQKQLLDETFRLKKKEEESRKEKIQYYVKKMQWIDMAQFNEKKKYKSLSTFRRILMGTIYVSLLIIGLVLYYSNTQHYIYDVSCQESYVTGIESFLLNLSLIRSPWYPSGEFVPEMAVYSVDYNFFYIVIIAIVAIIALFSSNIWHSPLVKIIYNIQDGDKSLKYRAIQNKRGKMGLCKVGDVKIKKILSFDYDSIFAIDSHSYICKKHGKIGIFNTDLKKMTVPVIYDDIYSIQDDSVCLIKDSHMHRFTHKGFRIVK